MTRYSTFKFMKISGKIFWVVLVNGCYENRKGGVSSKKFSKLEAAEKYAEHLRNAK